MSYNSLRERYGVSISTAPISFVKSGPDEYRSRDGGWIIKHRYRTGYQAHHEWRVTAPDGSLFDRGTGGRYYLALHDAVQNINEAIAYGVVGFLNNLYKWKRRQDEEDAKQKAIAKLRADREHTVLRVLTEHNIEHVRAAFVARRVVDQLFGEISS